MLTLNLGCDLISAHHVKNRSRWIAFWSKLPLGWVIIGIGNVCLGKAHQPKINGRASHLVPCVSEILVKECHSDIFERLQCDEKQGQEVSSHHGFKFSSII